MTEWKHRLLEKDVQSLKGVCLTCGPVDLVLQKQGRRNSKLRCRRGRTESKKKNLQPYGLSLEMANKFKEGKSCAICGRTQHLHVDHCHKTGRIRGVLRPRCNTRLAAVEDAAWLAA